jgi:crotonobetainyl-CoA:carnitine CoA-transferase CaiB-like acyl-CoA transferase
MHQPLEGIRIVEWGTFHAGPGGSAILGDMGAEVIKIEQPEGGDPMRRQMRYGQVSFDLSGGRNLFFEAANRNKKSVILNLKSEKGREIAYRLVAKSDVFLTNFRPEVVEKMGMTYQILSQLNPRLIYASVSAYGSRGPDSHRGGFDHQGQASSGLMFAVGEVDMPPLTIHFGVIDQATAIMVSHAIITSLLMRERFGIGQQVDISLLGSALYLQYINVLNALWLKQAVPRHQRSNTDPLRNHYRCQDGKWLSLGFPEHWGNRWPLFCQAIGRLELQNNSKFDTRERRFSNCEELISIFDHIFTTKPRDEWLEIFAQYDFIACPVNTSLDLDSDPQIVENDYIVDLDDPTMGKVRIPGFPIQFDQACVQTRSIGPLLGEHTIDVLKSLGGYSEGEISQLKEEGVI